MKKLRDILNYKSFVKVTALSLVFTLASCSGKKEEDADGSGGDKKEASADPKQALVDEAFGLMDEVATAFASVKDAETAKAVGPTLDGIATKFQALAKKMEAAGPVDDATKAKFKEMFDKKGEAMEEKMGAVMEGLGSDPAAATALMGPLMKFGTTMEGIQVFKDWGMDDGEGDEVIENETP